MNSQPAERSRNRLHGRPPLRAKLIFNLASGMASESPHQLAEIINQMQAWNIIPEVYLVDPDNPLEPVVREAIGRGIHLIVVSGGDGTIDNAIGAMVDTPAVMGIIPTGTRNNVAYSLGIPASIPDAVALLRRGRRIKLDVGCSSCGNNSRWFLEATSVGLFSALFPSADEIQKGNLTRIGDFLATLVASPLAKVQLFLDGEQEIDTHAHVVLVSNMPYVGAHFKVAEGISYNDNRLDVLLFSNLSKLDLIGYAVQVAGGLPSDERIQHYRVKSASIRTDPPLPVMADGYELGQGEVEITLRRRGLAVISGGAIPASTQPDSNKELAHEAGPQ